MLSEAELQLRLQQLRDGNPECVNPLTLHYRFFAVKIAKDVAKQYGIRRGRRGEMASEAQLVLIKTLRYLLVVFKDKLDMKDPTPYIYAAVISKLRTWLRQDHLVKPQFRQGFEFLDMAALDEMQKKNNHRAWEHIEIADIFKRLELDERTIRILKLKADGIKDTEIADLVGVTKSRIGQILTDVRERAHKVRRMIEHNDYI